ncbi:MAG TPA: hypothetical protein PKV70_08240, partial [Thermodesulfobacteriota bacterium]|nr:hypothetical protein [Thermodesulfobacteriota bacterium]
APDGAPAVDPDTLLPHWTDAPTGQVPIVVARESADAVDPWAAVPAPAGKPFTVAIALVIAIAGLSLLRAVLLRRNGRRAGGTWGCGFPYATPRMQYTASSFADPILHVFQG